MKIIEELNKALLNASRDGKTKDVLELISRGANVNAVDQWFDTSLHLACRDGHTDAALALISKGADIHAKDMLAHTPLHWAAIDGRSEIALALISKGADVNGKDKNGRTPLHFASLNGFPKTALVLISGGADVHAKNIHGDTSLKLASGNGYTEAALTLISHGANTSQANGKLKNLTMHQAAAQGGFTSRVIELLRQNSSILSQDAPETLADYARRHEKHDTAAAIQSFIASQAIDFMLKNTSPSTIFSRNQKS